MNYLKGEKFTLGYEYDFGVDGGATSTIPLRQFAGNAIDGSIWVTNAYCIVDTAITSGGTPTITFGNTTDADGYAINSLALLQGANLGFKTGQVAGALIWDDTNDVGIMYKPLIADDFDTSITIGTAALTAGKLRFFLECIG